MTKKEKAAQDCLKEIHKILEKRGFRFLPVPLFRQNNDGSFAVVVDLRIQKVNKEDVNGNG